MLVGSDKRPIYGYKLPLPGNGYWKSSGQPSIITTNIAISRFQVRGIDAELAIIRVS